MLLLRQIRISYQSGEAQADSSTLTQLGMSQEGTAKAVGVITKHDNLL